MRMKNALLMMMFPVFMILVDWDPQISGTSSIDPTPGKIPARDSGQITG
jgi:hypothetical protein